MIQRVCCLILLGGLDFGWLAVSAQDAALAGDPERQGGFELVADSESRTSEDPRIFTPLSPVTVEAEPVKLPEDQSLE